MVSMLVKLLAEVCHKAAEDGGSVFVDLADIISTPVPNHGVLYK